MTARSRLLGFLFVAGVMIQNYLAQVSHVPAAEIAKWTAHDWTGAILFVVGSGFTAWKAFLSDPKAPEVKP